MNDIEKLRNHIDTIDHRIISLLADRMRHVKAIGKFKKSEGKVSLDPDRWQHVMMDRKAFGNKHEISSLMIEKIWSIIHTYALEIEKGNE